MAYWVPVKKRLKEKSVSYKPGTYSETYPHVCAPIQLSENFI